jgi:tetratricopeptide (TPR) repeat protein
MRRCAEALAGMLLAAALAAGCGSPAPRVVNPPHELALASGQRAARALQRGDAAQALVLYEQALAAADSVEDFELSGAMLLNLALVHSRLGQPREAHQRIDRVLAAPARYAGALQAQAAARKALLLLDARDGTATLQWVARAEQDCAAPCGLAPLLANVRAQVALDGGNAAQAATHAIRAAELAGAAEQAAERANAERLLGRARMALGDRAGAAAALQAALAIDRTLGLPERIALDLLYAGDNAAAGGQVAAAREFFERALQVAEAATLPASMQAARSGLQALPPR